MLKTRTDFLSFYFIFSACGHLLSSLFTSRAGQCLASFNKSLFTNWPGLTKVLLLAGLAFTIISKRIVSELSVFLTGHSPEVNQWLIIFVHWVIFTFNFNKSLFCTEACQIYASSLSMVKGYVCSTNSSIK